MTIANYNLIYKKYINEVNLLINDLMIKSFLALTDTLNFTNAAKRLILVSRLSASTSPSWKMSLNVSFFSVQGAISP